MKPEKVRWIISYIRKNGLGVDILDSDFIDSYIGKFHNKFNGKSWQPTNYGAYKCKEVGRYLSKMYKSNILKRFIVSLGGNWQPGFPKWIYHYELASQDGEPKS